MSKRGRRWASPDMTTAGHLAEQLAGTDGTKDLVLHYLQQGPGGLMLEGADMTRTDGEWAWDEQLSDAIRDHDVRVPDGLFRTMCDRGFYAVLNE